MPSSSCALGLGSIVALTLASGSATAQTPVPPIVAPAPPPAVVAPPLVLRERPGSPVPKIALGFVITMNDYPAKPRKRREGGLTGFDLTVSREGQPLACVITKRSGSRELDETTCRLAMERMQFDPAIDASGVPATGIYSGQIKWDPARKPDAPLPGTITHTFIVELDGRVTDCRIAAVTGAAKKQYRVGPEPCRHSDVLVGRAPGEDAKRKLVTEVETITVSEVPGVP